MSNMPFGFGMSDDPSKPGGFDMSSLGAALQQLGQMMQSASAGDQSGPVNWEMVRDLARKAIAASADPAPTDAQVRAVIAALGMVDIWLDEAMTFPAVAVPGEAWSRALWLERTFPVWQRIVTPVAEQAASMAGPMGGGTDLTNLDSASLMESLPEQMRAMLPDGIPPEMLASLAPVMGIVQQLGAMAFSAQLGQALGALAGEVLDSSDIGIPLTENALCALLPGSIDQFADGLGVSRDDARAYLAARESAHQRLFAHVPWLRPRVIGAVEEYARGVRVDPERMNELMTDIDISNPEALQELLASGVLAPQNTPEQEVAITRLETLLALIEGWVDDVVDQATSDKLPAAVSLRETMRRRRAAGGPAEKTFATLVGMELRPKLLREASTLFAAARATYGVPARDALWNHPDLLPSSEDLAEPLDFVARMADPESFPDA
jgi:putative hydrolase